MSELDAQVVIICAHPRAVEFMLGVMRDIDYTPELVVTSFILEMWADIEDELKEYVVGIEGASIHYKDAFPADDYFGTITQFRDFVATEYKRNVSDSLTFPTYAGVLLLECIREAQTLDSEILKEVMETFRLETSFGTIS